MSLDEYQRKRTFAATPEPKGQARKTEDQPLFVIHKHDASHLHYDFRLLADGVLKSWAVPKGLSMDPNEKRLAIMVEDHPADYRTFEGVIPEGQYGAGPVMIWDQGAYRPVKDEDPATFVSHGINKGHFSFFLDGSFLKGGFTLIHLPKRAENAWLITKRPDEFANRPLDMDHGSAETGRSLEEIRAQAPVRRDMPQPDLSIDAPEAEMPRRVRPMLAVLIDKAFSDADWLFEIKWDGYRAIAEINNGATDLYSRNLISFKDRFPPIINSLNKLAPRMILDGEVVVVDDEGKSHFQLLQQYQKTGTGVPVYYVFDLIYFDRYDLTGLPLIERKEILRRVLPADLPYVRFCDHVAGRGEDFFAAAKAQGLEGIIGKRMTAPYRSGARSQDWVKIRNRLVAETVIGGYTAPKGSRQAFGSLIVGVYQNGDLTYAGHVGTGFTDDLLNEIAAKLKELPAESSPFSKPVTGNAPVRWVKPELTAEIEFNGWTDKGSMRQPVFIGLREDKPARDVVKETPQKFPQIVKSRALKIDDQEVIVTNPEKIYWPDEGYRKNDVIKYYDNIAEIMLPYLRDRPQSLHRFPDGISGPRFYQKDASGLNLPEWVETIDIESRSHGEKIKYLLCQNKPSLIYLANLGCIEINPWNSTKGALDHPDYAVIDLDPEETPFDNVIQTALALREILEELGIPSFPKTSGATGMHVYIPLGRQYNYGQTKQFSELISTLINKKLPATTSLSRSPGLRKGKVYPDFLQNLKGQTMAAPYSLRPEPGATVSTPLAWGEIKNGLTPDKFNIKTVFKRLEKIGDLFQGVLGPGIDMKAILENFAHR